jgi:hypothetical protein
MIDARLHCRLVRAVAMVMLGVAGSSACTTSDRIETSPADAGGSAGAPPANITTDPAVGCFSCEGYWICGGDTNRITLSPEADGCHLSELPGRNLLAPDGTITEGGAVVGHATGSGARVQVLHADGSRWLFCAGSGGCP